MRLILHVCMALGRGWTWKMAWRDCRSHRLKMLLFTSAIMVGVGALVAIRSFSTAAADSITDQARSLIGADLIIRSRRDLSQEVVDELKMIPGERSDQFAVVSMAYFPEAEATRLVQARSISGGFPWYGTIIAEPAAAMKAYERGECALVEKQLMTQFNIAIGDTVMLGGAPYEVVGALVELPGESALVGQLAPRVVIKNTSGKTDVTLFGTKVLHKVAFKLPDTVDLEALTDRLKALSQKHGFSYDTIETRTEKMGNRLSNLFNFLSLVGFVALLLGGVGVASSVHLYIRGKLQTVAMLHCVGAKNSQTVAIYVLQSMLMGLVGGALGAGLGTAIQYLIPMAFGNLFPFTVSLGIDWPSITLGILIGLVCTFLFSLLPLIGVRRVSPLMTLRADLEPEIAKDPARWCVYLLLLLGVATFAILNTPKVAFGLIFTAALLVAMGILYGLATLLMLLLKRLPIAWLPFHMRQGVKNLHRPGNQTRTLVLCVGIGVFLIMSQYFADEQLVRHVRSADASNKPNMVLFEVHNDQVDGVKALMATHKLPVLAEEPIVSMRLASVKGVPVEELRKRKKQSSRTGRHRRWIYNREFRVTSRSRLNDGEEIVAGTLEAFTKKNDPPFDTSSVPISVESDMARRLSVTLGDTIDFECKGTIIKTHVGSVRQVDWFRLQPNFFVVFPEGALGDKSTLTAIISRSDTADQANAFQLDSVKAFPNVWVIDLTTVVETFSSIQEKMAFTVRFMALFSVATGLMVLISTVHNSRDQRLRENTLLRTLGAKGRTVLIIMAIEYLMLGGLAALAGNLLAVAASWALTHFVFSIPYWINWLGIASSTAIIVGTTLAVGLLNTANTNRRPPLDVLRNT